MFVDREKRWLAMRRLGLHNVEMSQSNFFITCVSLVKRLRQNLMNFHACLSDWAEAGGCSRHYFFWKSLICRINPDFKLAKMH